MGIERKLSIVQMIVAVIVVIMGITNVLSSPEHNYIPIEFLQFFLGISMALQGVMLKIKNERKWLMFLSFGAATFCFYVSFTTFFT